MGVRGLGKFVRDRAHAVARVGRLREYLDSFDFVGKRTVVIDGNNLAYAIIAATHSPGCFGGEPAMYEHVWKEFIDTNFDAVEDIIFVVGNSIAAGTKEWKQRRENEHRKGSELVKLVQDGRMPQSLGQYGRNGTKKYRDGETMSPVWNVYLLAQIAASTDRVRVVQAEGDKDRAIMILAHELHCPVVSRDTDFLLFGNVSVISVNFVSQNAPCQVYEKGWWRQIPLRDFQLPLLAALAFNPEGQLTKEELEPFWIGLGWRGDDDPVSIVNYIVHWLINEVKDHDHCAKISSLVLKIDEVSKKETARLEFHFADQNRSDRLMETVSRFMVRNVGYPWKSDPNYRRPEQPQVIGAHPLVRAEKYNDEFEKLNDEVKSILLAQRASVLSSPLPFPILTEPNLHLYNTIHYPDDEAQLPSVDRLLTKYLKRELAILELDDAEYFHYKDVDDVKFMSTIIECDRDFVSLQKTKIQPIYNLYAATKKEKLRAYLACFDAEVLLYSVNRIETLTPCLLVFLSTLRYMAKQVKLRDWEVSAFVAQFALLDVFIHPNKHFGRLKWLTYGGEESSKPPVEIPADARHLVLANLFSSVYYATQRARVLCGRPFEGHPNPPDFKYVFSGAIFACVYRLLKENPDHQLHGVQACGLEDQNWIGIKNRNNQSEIKCYEKAATIYDKLMGYIRMFVEYDEKVRLDRRKQRESQTSKKVYEK